MAFSTSTTARWTILSSSVPLPPVRLGDVDPPRWARPVTPLLHPVVQVLEIGLQILPVLVPRHPVHPRCRLRVDHPVSRPQPAGGDVVQQRGEPCLLIPSCYLPHTIQVA